MIRRGSVWVLGAALGATGCGLLGGDEPPVVPSRTVGKARMLEVLSAPVIDVHTHTFNARYLPLYDIVLGKRDVSPLALFVYDGWARQIAGAVVKTARTACTPSGEDGVRTVAQLNAELAAELGTTVGALESNRCVQALFNLCERVDLRHRDHGEQGYDAEWLEQTVHATILPADLEDIRRALGLAGFALDLPAVELFITRMVTPDEDMEALYRSDFRDWVDLSVSHMMDLAPVYDEGGAGDPLGLSFAKQIECMARFQGREDSRQIYFVAYNPFRDHWPDARPGRALEIVTEALRERGAYGVKVYPPSGYRPSGNVIPSSPFALFTDHPERQWSARYEDACGDPVEACDLDQRLDGLFSFCAQYDIPVFTHAGPGEFEARKGYGRRMADPAFWRPVLKRYPTLRLCFGHAGGQAYWFGDEDLADWGRTVVELCRDYPNVYAEVGVLDPIVDPDKREHFIALVSELFARDPVLAGKLMYGSDWFMPTSARRPYDFLHGYREAFLDVRLEAHAEAFFFRNALAFLDVRERLNDGVHPVPAAVRPRLQALLGR